MKDHIHTAKGGPVFLLRHVFTLLLTTRCCTLRYSIATACYQTIVVTDVTLMNATIQDYRGIRHTVTYVMLLCATSQQCYCIFPNWYVCYVTVRYVKTMLRDITTILCTYVTLLYATIQHCFGALPFCYLRYNVVWYATSLLLYFTIRHFLVPYVPRCHCARETAVFLWPTYCNLFDPAEPISLRRETSISLGTLACYSVLQIRITKLPSKL